MTEPGAHASRGRTVGLAFAALALIALLPIVSVELPPILDYPNHMARLYVLAALADAPDLARYYTAVWTPLPNLALDAVVPFLARLMPIDIAMRLFLAAMLLGLAGGCVALHRAAFRRWSVFPLFAFLLLYNRILLWGFLNYLAGLALMLWALAAWVALEYRPAMRATVGMAAATAIYLCHLAAFGCFALAILALSAAPRPGERFGFADMPRRLAPAVLTLLPGVVLFLLAPTAGASLRFDYGNPLRKFDLPVSIFDNYDRLFDGATFAILLIAVIVGLARRAVALHARLRWSVLAVFIAFILVPNRFLSAAGIDHRLPVAIALLFVAASDWGAIAARRRQLIVASLTVLLLARMAVIETVWLHADRGYAALRQMFDGLPQGAKVAVAAPAGEVRAGGAPLYHFPTLAIIRRHAFVDTLFTDPLQQPLRLTATVSALRDNPPPGVLWDAAVAGALPPLPDYDDVAIVDPPKGFDPARLGGTVLFAAPRMILIQLAHPAPLPPAQPSSIDHPQ